MYLFSLHHFENFTKLRVLTGTNDYALIHAQINEISQPTMQNIEHLFSTVLIRACVFYQSYCLTQMSRYCTLQFSENSFNISIQSNRSYKFALASLLRIGAGTPELA